MILLTGGAAAAFVAAYLPWKGGVPALQEALRQVFRVRGGEYYFYWAGRNMVDAPSLLTWGAMAVKSPPFILALAALGAWGWHRSGLHRGTWRLLMIFILTYFISVLFMDCALSTVQWAPLYIGVAALAGGLAAATEKWRAGKKILLAGLIAAAGIDAAVSHPNYSAYFSPLAGGPDKGYRWLGDSDQDWGQSLPALARYVEKSGGAHVVLAYSGAGDPEAYGLRYTDLFSPALATKSHHDEALPPEDGRPVLLAVGTKLLQTEPRLFSWVEENLRPAVMVESCFFVYNVTHEPEAFRWMGSVYLDLRRQSKAAWAFQRAARLDPGNSSDAAVLSELQKNGPSSSRK